LVPVDGSENSLRALNTAVFLSTRTELQLTALNVMENTPTVYLQSIKGPAGQLQKAITSNTRKVQKYS